MLAVVLNEGVDRAEAALRLVQKDPRQARTIAAEVAHAARRAADPAAESTARRVLGLAARELHDAGTALRELRRGVRVADAAALPRQAAEARMSLALVLAEAGRPVGALREIEVAAPALDGLPAARLQMQRSLVLDRLSRFEEAMQGYTAALAVFRREKDQLWAARALVNRGVLHAYQGSVRQAETDLLAAARLYLDLGQELALAQVHHNLGFVLARAGDVPAALRWYDRADEYFARTVRPAVALMDRAELLLDARLLPEARVAAEAALAAARDGRMRLFEAQARLMLAEAALAEGDWGTALAQATSARRAFVRQGRPAWSALARYVALRAGDMRLTGKPVSAGRVRHARSVAHALSESGWVTPAVDAHLYTVRLAMAAAGRLRTAVRPAAIRAVAVELRAVRTEAARGPAHLRARAWHAEALVREAAGDLPGARRALLAGIRILHRYSATLGATELRVLAGQQAIDLAATGLRLARQGGRPRAVLWWGEQWKAASLRLPPVRPPDVIGLADDLARLRRVQAQSESAGNATAALRREQRDLEERIRRHSWRASGSLHRGAPRVDLTGLTDRLGDRALVELLDIDGDLHAVVVTRDGMRARSLGHTVEASGEVRALRFALKRIVTGHGVAASAAAARRSAEHATERIDQLVLAPLRPWIGDRELVLVPSGPLHATPWARLPSCRSRPLTVAPSASAWLAAAGRTRPSGALLVAGPGLEHAESEVRRLARVIPAATVLSPTDAYVDTVGKALGGVGLAHIAAHGDFRADNPMFSAVRLADGPLTVYDLERIAPAPHTVVLSACSVGLSAVHPGEELMGFTAALLGLGTATVLASTLPVHDASAQDLMIGLHRRLAAGVAPATALAAVQATAGEDLDERTVTAAAFGCFGAG